MVSTNMPTPYRLVWFQHFHKAAGSSIIDLAELNKEQFWPYHNNGNPIEENGNELKLWEYSIEELAGFVDSCEEKGVTFVATEWGTPNIEYLRSDNRVVLVTCLRNPLDRYVSNFYYDLYNGYTPARTLFEYESSRNRAITTFNYYCRVLLNINESSTKIGSKEFDTAASTLEKFDVCISLEEGFSRLSSALSWTHNNMHSNRVSTNFITIVKLLARAKLKLAYFRLKYPKTKPSKDFIEYFDAVNVWDLKLYNQVVKTNESRSTSHELNV